MCDFIKYDIGSTKDIFDQIYTWFDELYMCDSIKYNIDSMKYIFVQK